MKKSIITSSDNCYICEMYHGVRVKGQHLHHCWHGSYKQLADKDGLFVMLCVNCHTLLHDHGIHDRDLQEIAERSYLEYYNATIDDFRKRYGKNVL